ncbi:NAD dependent epimerase/dehydratase, putative [Ricinus communis]|uniref:NAD dependent epimerase/dehydratase, putative n=1 Tax=Ricinus communis TaxID=3988 RepID=B9TCW8_RICCO|nr:NAD dependent epimerase/dehydratase, putative [Ricinus communis]
MAVEKILVTGASGLLGANICRIAIEQGRQVRGLVRKSADGDVLKKLGVEPVLGDVCDPASLSRAIQGVDGVIHSAAVIGGTWSTATAADFDAVNYQGVVNVLDAARAANVRRSVLISTLAIVDRTFTITENSPLIPVDSQGSGYAHAKLGSYYAGMHRACRGEDIVFVLPGAMYGPSPFIDRALEPTLFTGTMYLALTGQLEKYARFPLTWPFVDDVANITLAALDKGKSGHRYLGGGRAEDACSLAEFCNMACEYAGVAHRVRDLLPDDADADIGSMRHFATIRVAEPPIDPTGTMRALGVSFTPLREGIAKTVDWLRANGRI